MNVEQHRALAAGLRALADRSRHASASLRVEQALVAAMERRAGADPLIAAPHSWRISFAAVAAVLLMLVAGAVWSARHQQRAELPTPADGEFVALPGAAALPEIETATIVRVSLPVSALPHYGVQILPAAFSGSVEAELLVAQDGHPRAIRFVHDPDSHRSRP